MRSFVLPLAFLVALATFLISESSYQQAVATFEKTGQQAQARTNIQVLWRSLTDAETGERGYLLTDRSEYLQPYLDAQGRANEALAWLNEYYKADPNTDALMKQISQASRNKLSELGETLKLHDDGKDEAWRNLMLSNIGQEVMERVRSLSQRLLDLEDANVASARESLTNTLLLNRIGVTAMTALSLLALYLYVRSSRALMRQRDEKHRLTEKLAARISEEVEREKVRIASAKDTLHAIGHEIRGPLQSLLAIHGPEADPSHRYIKRMLHAVEAIYGSSSPDQGIERAKIEQERLDIEAFLRSVAENSSALGIRDVTFSGVVRPVVVRADPSALEDVIAHLLTNAARYRPKGSPINISLSVQGGVAAVSVTNLGPRIPTDMLSRIFDYGVSDQPDGGTDGRRGQGLFVARTYLARMGASIRATNTADGVSFEFRMALNPA